MERMWVNQPSTAQPHHNLHGINVYADMDNITKCKRRGEEWVYIYPITGDAYGFEIRKLALSKGWLKRTEPTTLNLSSTGKDVKHEENL